MAVLLHLGLKNKIHARMSKKDTHKEPEVEETLANEPALETPAEAQVVVEDKKTTEEKLSEDLQNEKDKHLRLFAEFENYKKRTARERIELFKTAGEDVVKAVLPVLDDFDRALKEFSEDLQDPHVQGMMLISNKLKENEYLRVEEASVSARPRQLLKIHQELIKRPRSGIVSRSNHRSWSQTYATSWRGGQDVASF